MRRGKGICKPIQNDLSSISYDQRLSLSLNLPILEGYPLGFVINH